MRACDSASFAFGEFGSFVRLETVSYSLVGMKKGKRRRRNDATRGERGVARSSGLDRRQAEADGKGNRLLTWEFRRQPEQILKLSLRRQLRHSDVEFDSLLFSSTYGLANINPTSLKYLPN